MPPKIQVKIEETNVCKFRSTCILNTFSIDKNYEKKNQLGGGGVSGYESQKIHIIQITIHGN
jgi:hypothetical protein